MIIVEAKRNETRNECDTNIQIKLTDIDIRTHSLTMPFVQELIAIALQPAWAVIVKFACNPIWLFVSPLAYITDALYGVLIHNGANFSHDFIDDVSSESVSAEEAAA